MDRAVTDDRRFPTRGARVFPIEPAARKARAIAYGLAAVLFLGALALFVAAWLTWPLAIAALVLAAIGGAVTLTARATRAIRLELDHDRLQSHGTLFRKAIAYADIDRAKIRLADMTAERQLQPALRIGGAALPGFLEGWFLLRNRSRALMYVTRRTDVVLIPTRRSYVVLFSARDPEELISQLRSDIGRQDG